MDRIIFVENKSEQNNKKYLDILEQFYTQESIVKEIEEELRQLESKRDYYEKYFQYKFFPIATIFSVLMGVFMGLIIFFDSKSEILLTLLISFSFSCLFGSLGFANKHNKKEALANLSEIEFLQKRLKTELEKLDGLKNSLNDLEQSRVVTVKNVDILERLKNLKKSIKLYNDFGRKSGEYKSSLEQGTLDIELNGIFDESEIETAHEFLEKNGHIIEMQPKNNK